MTAVNAAVLTGTGVAAAPGSQALMMIETSPELGSHSRSARSDSSVERGTWREAHRVLALLHGPAEKRALLFAFVSRSKARSSDFGKRENAPLPLAADVPFGADITSIVVERADEAAPTVCKRRRQPAPNVSRPLIRTAGPPAAE
jgi:hypothetical protein